MRTFTDDELTRFIAKVREEAKAEIREDFVLTRANIGKSKRKPGTRVMRLAVRPLMERPPRAGKSYDPEPNPYRIEGQLTAIYDRACTTCGHKINDHDVNECWKTMDGKQCDCGWMGVPR